MKNTVGQHIYFYLNHPIQFVRLVGVVVAIDDINTKYTVLTLDDGSGATVEVKIIRLTSGNYNPVDSPSNTQVSNVNVLSGLGVFEVTIDGQPVDIGTVLNAKCTISEFRHQKQLELKRVRIVRTTNEEAKAWAEAAAFKREVLSIPWHISSTEHRQIKKEIKMRKKQEEEEQRREAEKEAKIRRRKEAYDAYMAQREEKLERRRRKEEVMMNAGALI
jgi:hypothetical protein